MICSFLTFFFFLLAIANCYHIFDFLSQCHLGLIRKGDLAVQIQEQIIAAERNNEKILNMPESTASNSYSMELLVFLGATAVVVVVVAAVRSFGG